MPRYPNNMDVTHPKGDLEFSKCLMDSQLSYIVWSQTMEIYGYGLTPYYIFNLDCPLEIGSVHHWELPESSRLLDLLGLQALAAKIVFTKSPRQTTWTKRWQPLSFQVSMLSRTSTDQRTWIKLDCFHHSIGSSFKGPGEEGGNFEAAPTLSWKTWSTSMMICQTCSKHSASWRFEQLLIPALDPCFHLSETRAVLYCWYWNPTYQVRYEWKLHEPHLPHPMELSEVQSLPRRRSEQMPNFPSLAHSLYSKHSPGRFGTFFVTGKEQSKTQRCLYVILHVMWI